MAPKSACAGGETLIWESELAQGGHVGEVYCRNPRLSRLRRDIRATLPDYDRISKDMEELQAEEDHFERKEREEFRRYARQTILEEVLAEHKRRKSGEAPEDGPPADGVDAEAVSDANGGTATDVDGEVDSVDGEADSVEVEGVSDADGEAGSDVDAEAVSGGDREVFTDVDGEAGGGEESGDAEQKGGDDPKS